jgi:uncharacterized delta-60 repeat protein
MSFDGDGKVENINDISSGAQPVVTLQNDGKILLSCMGGVGGQQHYCTMRFLDDGTLDNTFSEDGIQLTLIPGDYNWPGNIAIQPDQKIVIAGYSGPWQFEHFSLIRLGTDGNPDTEFANNGIFTYSINQGLDIFNDVIVQPDGKILACGYTIASDGTYDFVAMRMNDDGSIDSGFGENGVLNQAFSYTECRAVAMAIQPDGKLLIAGDAPDFANHHTALARYDAQIPATIDNTLKPSDSIRVYPNPTDGVVLIDAPNLIIQEVILFDQLGNRVTLHQESFSQHILEVNTLSPGLYRLLVLDDSGCTFFSSIIVK